MANVTEPSEKTTINMGLVLKNTSSWYPPKIPRQITASILKAILEYLPSSLAWVEMLGLGLLVFFNRDSMRRFHTAIAVKNGPRFNCQFRSGNVSVKNSGAF